MNNKPNERIIADCIFFLSFFFLPWWVGVGLAIVFVSRYDFFVELLPAGLLLDTLYGTGPHGLLYGFPFTISFSILFLTSFYFKEHFTFSS